MSTSPENFDLWKILSETKLVVRSHGRHYFLLSLLFLLPTSSLIIFYPIFLQNIFFFNSDHQPFPHFPTISNLLYIFTVTLLYISGAAPITYTTFHVLCHNNNSNSVPINLLSSVKSIFPSFLPLASSLIIQELIFISFSWPFVEELLQIYIKNESFYNYYNNPFIILLRLVLVLALVFLQANWTLSSAIAVWDSNINNDDDNGSLTLILKPLRKSSQLVSKSGKTGVALSMVLLFDLMWATFFSGFYYIVVYENKGRYWDSRVGFYMIISLVYMMMTLLLNMVASVVLYFHYLDIHGEVPFPYSTLEEGSLP